MNWLRDLNTLFDVLKQASMEFVKTLAEHTNEGSQKADWWRQWTAKN